MELTIKNKMSSFRGSSNVIDKDGKKVYFVKGSWTSNSFSRKYKKKVMDMSGNLLYIVCNKRIHGILKGQALIYDPNKNLVATITENGAFKSGYQIEGATEKMEISGSIFMGADILLGNKKIGKISLPTGANGGLKLTLNTQFKLDIKDPKDAPFIVALVIGIDNINDSRNDHANHR